MPCSTRPHALQRDPGLLTGINLGQLTLGQANPFCQLIEGQTALQSKRPDTLADKLFNGRSFLHGWFRLPHEQSFPQKKLCWQPYFNAEGVLGYWLSALREAPGIQSVPANGTLAMAAASTVKATRSSGSRFNT